MQQLDSHDITKRTFAAVADYYLKKRYNYIDGVTNMIYTLMYVFKLHAVQMHSR